jgi:hypothetical protein
LAESERFLTPEVTVVVHPIDTAVHPSNPPGWRWAVMVGGAPPAQLDFCAGAGWSADASSASVDGETAGSTATKALRMLGVPVRYAFLRLGYDPIPASADERPLAIWHGEADE